MDNNNKFDSNAFASLRKYPHHNDGYSEISSVSLVDNIDIENEVSKCTAELESRNLRAGDMVAAILANTREAICYMYAAMEKRITINFLDPKIDISENLNSIMHNNYKLLLVNQDKYQEIISITNDPNILGSIIVVGLSNSIENQNNDTIRMGTK